MTGLPVTRIERHHRPPGPPLGRARVPQRARARHRRHHRRRAGGGGPRTTRRRRAVQRVVGLGAHPGGRRPRREPPVVEGRGVRAGVRRAGPRRAGPGRLGVLLPPTAHRAVGGGSSSRGCPSTTAPFAAATAPSTRTRPSGSTTGAAAATSAASSTSSWPRSWTARDLEAVFAGDEPLQNPANEERFRTLLGLGAGAKPFECVGDIDECRARPAAGGPATGPRRAPSSLTRLRAELPATPHPPTPPPCCSRAAPTAFRIAMRQPISWSALADASVGVWGLGVEGQASIRRLRVHGPRRRSWSTTRPPHPRSTGSRSWPPGRAAWTRSRRCDVVVKSPGISRYRPEVAQLEEAGVAVCGGLGLFMAEADPTRVACITGTKGKSTTTALAVHLLAGLGVRRPGGREHRACRPGTPPAARHRTTGSSRRRASRSPTCTTRPPVVAVTSLSPDHLDWHGTVERYYADKLSLCTKPGVALALADGADAELRSAGRAPRPAPPLGRAPPRWSGTPAGRRPSA